jgi:penicillin-binding protein 2
MHRFSTVFAQRAISVSLLLVAVCTSAPAATKHRKKRTTKPAARHAAVVRKTAVAATAAIRKTTVAPGPVIRGGPWTEPTFADSTAGDFIDGDDLTIRKAAVDALGPYNGSVVVVDPQSGRVLTMVNQRVALGSGFQPCSTIKISVALAGLRERVIDPESKFRLSGMRMDLTYALAHSNNYYFATLGSRLGYEKVSYYAHLFGYGERAGLNIPGEQPGHYPPAPPKNGGVGMLTSFGEEIQ